MRQPGGFAVKTVGNAGRAPFETAGNGMRQPEGCLKNHARYKVFRIEVDYNSNVRAEEGSTMGANGVSGLTSQLTEYLTQMQEKQLETLAVPADAVATALPGLQADAVTISEQGYAKSQSLLANQISGAKETEKSYLDVKIDSFSTQKSLQNSMNDALGSSLESVIAQAAFWYGDKRMRNAKMMKDATESHQEVFTEMKDTIEEKAAEATAPKDKDGKPIEQAGTASASESAPAQTVAAPVAEAASASALPSEVAVDLEGVSQAAPAVASISIEV